MKNQNIAIIHIIFLLLSGFERNHLEMVTIWTSLLAQWLRLWAPNAGGLGSIPGQETRSHMLQLRPGAAK